MKAEVYYNVRKRCLSVRFNGKVIAHAPTVSLMNPTFHVSESGRQRVLANKRKNVHAFVRGEWDGTLRTGGSSVVPENSVAVKYNPYKYKTFVLAQTETPIHSGRFALISGNKIFVQQ